MCELNYCCNWRQSSLLTKTGNFHIQVKIHIQDTQTYGRFFIFLFTSLENLKYMIVTGVGSCATALQAEAH